jgi:hypothetical protein
MAGAAAVLLTGSANLMAQPAGGGRGQFDPAQMQQRMLERYKETLAVTDEAEWKVISERITKVMTARREAMVGGFGGMGRRGGGPGGPAVSPEVEALQKAIEANNAGEIKAKLAAVREARAKKQAELKAAQEELKKVLSAKQEAQMVLGGMLE